MNSNFQRLIKWCTGRAALPAVNDHYAYEIEDHRGNRKKGILRAHSLPGAIRTLERRSKTIFSVQKAEERSVLLLRRWNPDGVHLFFRQLSVMVKSGLPLKYAITVLKTQQEDAEAKDIVSHLERGLERGLSFSESLAQFPQIFSKFHRSIIKASEEGGFLDVSLLYLASVMEKETLIRQKVRGALNYPIAICAVGIAGTVFIFYWIFPYLKMLITDLKIELPLYSRIVFTIAERLEKYYILIPVAILVYILLKNLVHASRNTLQGRLFWERIVLHTPVVKDIKKKEILTHALYILACLTEAGISVVPSFELAGESCGNLYIEGAFQDVVEKLREGGSLNDGMNSHNDIFPRTMIAMITVGEESGELSEVLAKTAEMYESELFHDIEGFTRLIEPVAIGGLGLLIGFLIVSFLVPIYTAVNHF